MSTTAQTITAEQLAELKEKAQECQAIGKWYSLHSLTSFPEHAADEEFVLAASPSTVLALIATIEQQRAELERMKAAPVGVPDDLRARCSEIINWQKSGLLKGDALRGYARAQWYANEYNSLQLAETDTARQAYAVLAAPAAPAPAAQELWKDKALSFAKFVKKCLRQNGEYAPLSHQEVDELIRALEATPPAAEQPDTVSVDVHDVAEFLLSIGWKNAADAQWTRLHEAIPELRALLVGGAE